MKLCKIHKFGNITGYELGYGYIGKPYMTTIFYSIGNVIIDTGLSHLRREALEIVRDKKIDCILLTHHHEDHSGNVAAIMKAKQAPAYGHPKTIEKMRDGFKILMYQHLIHKNFEAVTHFFNSFWMAIGRGCFAFMMAATFPL